MSTLCKVPARCRTPTGELTSTLATKQLPLPIDPKIRPPLPPNSFRSSRRKGSPATPRLIGTSEKRRSRCDAQATIAGIASNKSASRPPLFFITSYLLSHFVTFCNLARPRLAAELGLACLTVRISCAIVSHATRPAAPRVEPLLCLWQSRNCDPALLFSLRYRHRHLPECLHLAPSGKRLHRFARLPLPALPQTGQAARQHSRLP